MEQKDFRAGFVSIVGRPNVGKSSLMNKLVGENVSIITAKAQTTRHRIMGILNGANYQIVYSDTPGILEPVDSRPFHTQCRRVIGRQVPVVDPAVSEEIREQRSVPRNDIRRKIFVPFDDSL